MCDVAGEGDPVLIPNQHVLENRVQRRQLSRGLRELRHRRLNDIRDRYEAIYDEEDDPV